VARCGDASRAVNVDPDVPLFTLARLARVDPDPNPDAARLRQGGLRRHGSGDRVGRLLERDEEGVTPCIELQTVMAGEHRTEHDAMIHQRLFVLVAELKQQASRTLDIGEQQSDGAARQRRHAIFYLVQGAGGNASTVTLEAIVGNMPLFEPIFEALEAMLARQEEEA
jgi:hypothetical protein